MLGHKLWQMFRDRHETWVTMRSSFRCYSRYDLFDSNRTLDRVDVLAFDTVTRALAAVHPEIVINCVGIIKQIPEAKDPVASISVNALFPHRLADLCQAAGARLIHISTDCVFSGRRGMYTEDDVSDAEDLYGRTKFLGEVANPNCLTLRTSIIGRELESKNGLVEWFLSNRNGKVRGFTRAIYSGLTTQALARLIRGVATEHSKIAGLYHVSSEPITKYDLLCLLRDAFNREVEVEPYPEVQVDRSLDSSKLRSVTGFKPATWDEMVHEMANDPTPYNKWRNNHAS